MQNKVERVQQKADEFMKAFLELLNEEGDDCVEQIKTLSLKDYEIDRILKSTTLNINLDGYARKLIFILIRDLKGEAEKSEWLRAAGQQNIVLSNNWFYETIKKLEQNRFIIQNPLFESKKSYRINMELFDARRR